MDLQEQLFASRKNPQKRLKGAAPASVVLHGLLIGAIVLGGAKTKHSVAAEKPIDAFITQGAAPPPPPPPPPPKKASGGQKAQPRVQPKPVVIPQPQPSFTAPVEIPKEVPKVDALPVTKSMPVPDLPVVESLPDAGSGEGGDAVNGVEGGVDGGVAGGVAGGIVGGEVGGVVGGEIGGVKGGELGGKLGGQVGGTGTGTEGTGTGGPEAPVAPEPPPPPPPPPSGPLRVGGDVKAPVIVSSVDPQYTEAARKARIAGVVVVEAIIDKNGNVDHVKVIKGLPGGLGDQAEQAVRRWKFRPGTMNGRPVDTIFNLTVTFKLE